MAAMAHHAARATSAASTLHYVDDLVGPGLAAMYPVDIAATADDYYVMDPGRYRVVRIDRATGAVVDSIGGHQGRQLGQFGAARAIALDAQGRVYVADTPNNRVQRFSSDLTYQTSWGSIGTGPGQFSQVYGIAVGPGKLADGSSGQVVYTTDGDRVQKFTTGGVFISQFGRKSLNEPRQLDVDPNTHDVYVASARDRKVVVFAPNGKRLFRFGGEGTGNGQFMGDIRGVEVSDTGRVFVSDDGNQRVQVFTSKGRYLYQFGNTGTGAKRLVDARGLTTTPDGTVVVADEWAFALKEWTYTKTAATFQRQLFGSGPPAPGVNSPRGMAVDPGSGALYAVDWWNQRIEKFGAAGAYQLQWGQRGTKQEPGSINFAWDAAVDPATGNVFVANRESHEIEVFAPNGDYVTRWGTRGTTDGKLTFPQGVAFDPTDGSLLVADSGNDRIQRFDILPSGEGQWVATYGGHGTAPGEFDVPTGIAVGADGTIWVADTRNYRIERRDPGGAWTVFTQAAGDTTTFKSPWGVSVGPDGSIWVADTGRSRIVKMSAAGVLSYSADGPSLGLGPIDGPFDVAFGPAGQIYVSLVWDNRILHLEE
jgi:tripartite motif-containing protein 71